MKQNFTLLRSTLEVTFTTKKVTCEIWTRRKRLSSFSALLLLLLLLLLFTNELV